LGPAAGDHAPSIDAELTAAGVALQAAGIALSVTSRSGRVDAMHETSVAWTLREAVTNVVKHSGAHQCRISIEVVDGVTQLEVVDDGCGRAAGTPGIGLAGMADRVLALGGAFEAGRRDGDTGGFRGRASFGAAALAPSNAGTVR